MKKLFLLLAAGMMFTACGSDDNNVNNNGNGNGSNDNPPVDEPVEASISLSKESVSIAPEGGEVSVIVYSNGDWSVTTENDWCTASVNGGEACEDGQEITLSARLAYDKREATFVFTCGDAEETLTVSQDFVKAVVAEGAQQFEVAAEGGSVELAYKANVECEVVIPEDAQSWISIPEATKGLESATATLTIAENELYEGREAVVKVVAVENDELYVEYTISQAAAAIEAHYYMLYSASGVVTPNEDADFGATITSNTWNETKGGVIEFDAPVTKIGTQAFMNCTTLTSITIPETVTEIGTQAFYGCTALQSFKGQFASEDGQSLIVDKTLVAQIIKSGVTKYTTPADIEGIGAMVFYGWTELTDVDILKNITAIGASAFEGCSNLVSVDCEGETPATLGAKAFDGCAEALQINVPIKGYEAYTAAEGWKEYNVLPYFGVVIE